uniref:Clip domain-containing protein n=1 Tax=Timema poppense TaxID=170557 RepID=A0A7R9H8J4_TIMPO|nr:unnamed protein product [Timema poppensis]
MICKNMCLAAVTSDSQYVGIYLNVDCQKSAVNCQSAPKKLWGYCMSMAIDDAEAEDNPSVSAQSLEQPRDPNELDTTLSEQGIKTMLPIYNLEAAPDGRLQDLEWLPPVTDWYHVALPTGPYPSLEMLEIGYNEVNHPFAACKTPKDEDGHCRHLPHCILEEFKYSLVVYLEYFCRIGSFVGVCCPDELQPPDLPNN